jgi:hypothetical protein
MAWPPVFVLFRTKRGNVLRCTHCGAEMELRGFGVRDAERWAADHELQCPQRPLPGELPG